MGMTIDKAIEILQLENNATLRPRNDDYWQAVELLIEAGKRLKYHRDIRAVSRIALLPGETGGD